ncbi:MAG: glycogen debranching protein GlgX [Pseudanabaenaceae cyanobacterium SKYGB_i_bin29]|nr:glycogen debranching protein GlgX [Pseudanabaenaceae cyanobacterium SKYG29]MDW8420532.1 glycogen debranching protein GlgX [Pseudanabaenaceae cyanobacterium SKYGB_i_bin29]
MTDVLPGTSYPLGATLREDGVNFCLFSRNAYAVELLLFDDVDDPRPSRVIDLDPQKNRTFHYWHVFVKHLQEGQLYGYRVFGPYAPYLGHRFDGNKVLLDPYTKAVAMGKHYSRLAAMRPGDNAAQCLKSVVVGQGGYDWEEDTPIHRPFAKTVIYEMHVAGFTQHPSSGLPDHLRGTYRGVIEKIPYLQSLGITAVELLPVQYYDPQDARPGLTNYWGYSPLAFFAPYSGYSSASDPIGVINEFKDMVKALHRAGIEVILDVVFNHTAEGDQHGPTFSFKGLENSVYYILDPQGMGYKNYSGCGNTLKTNHGIVQRLILDCLRYWVAEMHVDGFRFDLASVFSRGESGQILKNPPILWAIEFEPVLAGVKLIAEAWDAGGLYQVGSFVGERFTEWNGPYRDDVRKFVKGDDGIVEHFASRIIASPDIYRQPNREPNRSIHFITCHDGFTLNDLVSYNEKHNWNNLEDNKDGANDNFSWNCGVEGETDDPEINQLRLRQIKNFFTILFISQGTPMILMGDEVRRTQKGNNNAYCQNNEISWFNWDSVEKEAHLLRFVQSLIRFAQERAILAVEQFLHIGFDEYQPSIVWHGVELEEPDWGYFSHSLAFTLYHPKPQEEYLHVICNAYWEPLDFALPPLPPNWHWHRIVDTYLPSPDDFSPPETAAYVASDRYRAMPRSTIVLMALAR